MRNAAAVIVLLVASLALAQDEKTGGGEVDPLHPRVRMETTLGPIVLELDAAKAPVSTENFLGYVEDKFYEGTIFHRVIANFMVQGGGLEPDMDRKPGEGKPIKNECDNGLKNERGTIAMARTTNPNSATCQFFINVVDNARLDGGPRSPGYAVFGKVVDGMDVVDKIRDAKLIKHDKYPGPQPVTPAEPVIIQACAIEGGLTKARVVEAIRESARKMSAADEGAKLELIKKAEQEAGGKFQTSDSGLMWLTLSAGDGPSPTTTDTVRVHYTGWLLNGAKFDSSYDHPGGGPTQFRLDGVIKGWIEGVSTMKVGEKRKLIIPPDLAYGSGGVPGIPPNSTLVFDVELIEIK